MKNQNPEEKQIARRSITGGPNIHPKTEGIATLKARISTEPPEQLCPLELQQRLRDLQLQNLDLEVQNTELLRKLSKAESLPDRQTIVRLFENYTRMYSFRDDLLTAEFSNDFSGFTGGGDFLVKDKEEWVAITRQDFAQVKDPIRIELKDLSIQSLAAEIAVATGFFIIHLPIEDHILSHQTARLVLIFRNEAAGWKICHSSISIPYHLVSAGEIYPLKELTERNQSLERLVDERTNELSAANNSLENVNAELAKQIAQHKLVEEALRRSEELYRSSIHASPDNITITDSEGRILLVSPVALSMFCAAREEQFLGHSVLEFIASEDRARALAQMERRRQGDAAGPTEYRGRRLDGTTFEIEVNSESIRDTGGSPTGMVVIVRDITDRKHAELEQAELKSRLAEHATELERLNALLHEQALEDSLTGLANRRQFTATLDHEIRRARREKGEISLLIADVDLFKRFNDTLGHQRGDECLERVEQVLKATFRRPGELPARYGGEEFAVILPNCGSKTAIAMAERLRRAMEKAGVVHPSSEVSPFLTLSIGITSVRVLAGVTAKVLIQAADKALYRSKAEGRNRVTAGAVEGLDQNPG